MATHMDTKLLPRWRTTRRFTEMSQNEHKLCSAWRIIVPLKVLSHMLQQWGRPSSCLLALWRRRAPFSVKRCSQTSQPNGRSPVCVRLCLSRLAGGKNTGLEIHEWKTCDIVGVQASFQNWPLGGIMCEKTMTVNVLGVFLLFFVLNLKDNYGNYNYLQLFSLWQTDIIVRQSFRATGILKSETYEKKGRKTKKQKPNM